MRRASQFSFIDAGIISEKMNINLSGRLEVDQQRLAARCPGKLE